MSKERLEEIEFKRACERRVAPGMGKSNHIDNNDIDWLVERVQELETYKKSMEELYRHMREEKKALQQQNKRYRETINIMSRILKDAIHSLDIGEKVQGLEYGVKMADEVLEGEE